MKKISFNYNNYTIVYDNDWYVKELGNMCFSTDAEAYEYIDQISNND